MIGWNCETRDDGWLGGIVLIETKDDVWLGGIVKPRMIYGWV